jgi:hypothetical protein
MKMIKFILRVTFACLLSVSCFGQPCKDFQRTKDCYVYVPMDRDFKEYNQSKSVYTEVGTVNAFKIVLYGKKDFIVGICAESMFYRQIRLRIFDGQTNKLLYDNKDYDYIESFGFTVEHTMPLYLEVTVFSKDEKNQHKKTCLGLQILSAKVVEPEAKK